MSRSQYVNMAIVEKLERDNPQQAEFYGNLV